MMLTQRTYRKFETADEDSHSTDFSVSGEEGNSTILLVHYFFSGFNLRQSWLATLVTPQNFTKMLRNLTFVVQFAYFSIRPKKGFCFFEQLSLQKAPFEKLRETFWKISSNLWKALILVATPPDWVNLYWCSYGADGRVDVRWLPNFLTHGAPLRARELRY